MEFRHFCWQHSKWQQHPQDRLEEVVEVDREVHPIILTMVLEDGVSFPETGEDRTDHQVGDRTGHQVEGQMGRQAEDRTDRLAVGQMGHPVEGHPMVDRQEGLQEDRRVSPMDRQEAEVAVEDRRRHRAAEEPERLWLLDQGRMIGWL